MSTVRPQFINLYQKPTGWQSRVLKSRGTGLALATLAVGLALVTGFSAIRMHYGEVAAGEVTAGANIRNASLQAATTEYEANDNYRKLQQRVEQLQRIIARQDVVLQRLQSTDLVAMASYSTRLAAIGQAHIDGIWLTQVNFQSTPASLKLTGVAMDPSLLPRYLVQLGDKARLAVHQLQNLSVDRSVTDPRASEAGAVGFNLVLQNADGQGPS